MPTDLPTQLAYPARAILRTIVQSLVGLLGAWLVRYVGIPLEDDLALSLVDLITAVAWVGLTALAAWVMTRPSVAKVLSGTPLAPAPYTPERAAELTLTNDPTP